ncbi:hypothetical protein EYF80_035973 [Liparis tanakae]|uniref:Uncharacterized protein n=1 Tax=Liparis tanakae TaxID=230148 RepID=A0A4Z2GJT7_9TELE|nr:hypothetical protein EYF80_035973 [Liparis tanakae]
MGSGGAAFADPRCTFWGTGIATLSTLHFLSLAKHQRADVTLAQLSHNMTMMDRKRHAAKIHRGRPERLQNDSYRMKLKRSVSHSIVLTHPNQ